MKLLRTTVLTVAVLVAFSLDASAQMAVKKISFSSTNGTPPFDQSVTGVGLGVAGEAVLFFWTDQTAEGTAGGQFMGFGAATSATQEWAVSIFNEDNVNPTNNTRDTATNRCILSTAPTFAAEFKSFDGADGNFTVTWQANPGAGRIIHAFVIGGTDLTNAIATTIDLNSSTGNQAYAHGLGATPDFGFYATTNQTVAGGTNHATLAVGWAVSTTKRGSVSINADDGVSMTNFMDWNRITANDRALVCLSNAASTLDIELDHVSFDATNVTFNQINAPENGTDLYALFLAGGQYDAGAFNSCNTANCTDTITTAFQPTAVVLASAQLPNQDAINRTVSANANLAFGAFTSTDGTQEGSCASAASDAVLSTQADQRTVTTKAISILLNGGPATVNAEADGTGLNATDFQVQWSTAQNLGLFWFAIGDAAAPSPRNRAIIISRKVITNIEPREYEVVEGR